jgi:endonuclease G
MMDKAVTSSIAARISESAEQRSHVRSLVRRGRWLDAETDPDRLTQFVRSHVATVAPRGAEAIQGDTSELQAARFLPLGALVRRAVAYVEVLTDEVSDAGTGFLISPQLFITNAHVLPDEAAVRAARVTFDHELDGAGQPTLTTTFSLDPATLAMFSPEDDLDFAVVALGERVSGSAAVEELGYVPLLNWSDKHVIGMPVNIIQHPNRWPKMIAIRNNFLAYRTDRTLLYETDTDHGSSGSPVFNDDFELVALHHYGEPHNETGDDEGKPFPTNVNEGIRISAIFNDLTARAGELSARGRALLTQALSYASLRAGDGAAASAGGHVLDGPHPSGEAALVTSTDPEALVTMTATNGQNEANEVRVTIPVEVSVRIGTTDSASGPRTRLAPPLPRRGPEAVHLDLDYSNRAGYNAKFIKGHQLPIPELATARLKQQLASVDGNQSGELKYEHFSVKVNRKKRIAIFTATNIDGPTYLDVDRKTGRVKADEGDKWFVDDRIDEAHVLGQGFYGNWSDLFDRGHLTRRSDPTWGSVEDAERANADTFHFTNCSPQHWLFNESATYWQGLERYVLENGELDAATRGRICVFQGPIFDDAVDHWAEEDHVQIPSEFWKIVVWKGREQLKAVGLVVDQLPIIDIIRRPNRPPEDLPAVDVNHWRVAIPIIERRTGLKFIDEIGQADTISSAAQPDVGEEAAQPVRALADVKL